MIHPDDPDSLSTHSLTSLQSMISDIDQILMMLPAYKALLKFIPWISVIMVTGRGRKEHNGCY
jgi:hypothetical protein